MAFPSSSALTGVSAVVGLSLSQSRSEHQRSVPEGPGTVPPGPKPKSHEAQIAELQADITMLENWHQKAQFQLHRYARSFSELTAINLSLEAETKKLREQLAERDSVIAYQQSTLERAMDVNVKLEQLYAKSQHRTKEGEVDAAPP